MARGHTVVLFLHLTKVSDTKAKKKVVWLQEKLNKPDKIIKDLQSCSKKHKLTLLNTKIRHIKLNKQFNAPFMTALKSFEAIKKEAEKN